MSGGGGGWALGQRKGKKSRFLRYVSGPSTVEKQVPLKKAVGIRERYSGKGRKLKIYGANSPPVQRREKKSEFLRYVSGPSTVEKQVPLKKAVGIRERYSGKGRNQDFYGMFLAPVP